MSTLRSSRPPWVRFRLGYAVILLAVIIFSVKFMGKAWDDHRLGAQLSAVRTHLSMEARDNAKLSRRIKQYQNLTYLGQVARRWGYVAAGDKPVIISYRYKHQQARVVVSAPKPPVPTWQQWWNVFLGGSGN